MGEVSLERRLGQNLWGLILGMDTKADTKEGKWMKIKERGEKAAF